VRSITYIILKNYFPMRAAVTGETSFIGSHLARGEKI
jgi:hypothetical protein